jgi:hypothetical protein
VIMRAPIVLTLLASVAPAAAQPTTAPDPCAVTISPAPEDVREVVEAWVEAADGALVAAARIGNWAVHAGPVVSVYKQSFKARATLSAEPMDKTVYRAPFDVLVWTGVRRAL